MALSCIIFYALCTPDPTPDPTPFIKYEKYERIVCTGKVMAKVVLLFHIVA